MPVVSELKPTCPDLLDYRLARIRIEHVWAQVAVPREVEHIEQRTGKRIKGALADTFTAEPVVFDEVDGRSLIEQRVIDEVHL